ncbi:MAG: sensor histidine kinase [Chloroflexi bacterium]|nr:sensor histidine kinase [Chloroflexota bacterium]
MGIPEEDIPFLFDRFFRGEVVVSQAIPGTGLGLAICQEIVRRYNGRIDVTSVAKQGANFHCLSADGPPGRLTQRTLYGNPIRSPFFCPKRLRSGRGACWVNPWCAWTTAVASAAVSWKRKRTAPVSSPTWPAMATGPITAVLPRARPLCLARLVLLTFTSPMACTGCSTSLPDKKDRPTPCLFARCSR